MMCAQAGDFNGDGKDDFIKPFCPGCTTAAWTMHLSRGDGTFYQSTLFGEKHHDPDDKYLVADVTGDGAQDLIVLRDDGANQVLTTAASPPADLMVKATDGLGLSAQIGYVPLRPSILPRGSRPGWVGVTTPIEAPRSQRRARPWTCKRRCTSCRTPSGTRRCRDQRIGFDGHDEVRIAA